MYTLILLRSHCTLSTRVVLTTIKTMYSITTIILLHILLHYIINIVI